MAARDSNKSTLYVGGLDEQVTSQVLHAAFIPFGEITQIEIPPDPTSKFDLPADAQAAQDNMHLSELFGRTIKVNLAKPLKGGSGPGGLGRGPEKAIWADEDWIKQNVLSDEQAPQSEGTNPPAVSS
ncbi:hypothetical protein EC968_004034 [Mortierella alpina]|nr:hypothetical protein EC968_004034 [Mortierella alpina]